MPGKIKVKVLAGRNLPVMDRASDTTDAFVEVKFGSVTHKTDVCRKSLNPHWSSTEWYRFEVDESELQDEPLQLRLMDHDTYSANDAIGKVVISLAPLLAREVYNTKNLGAAPGGAVMSGWIPVFDTMHGIRGELNVIVKVELFSDFNKYKTSSCGVQFFHCPTIPPGYKATAVHGFVEELVVNDDPEYQWIDKIRTPRASNEARQVAFIKLSNQVQRLVGLKAAELGANAVVGYQQDFDLEGEAGVVARAIGTAVSVTLLPTPCQAINIPPCTQQQLKKYLDILATDTENITDLNQYFQNHQDELKKFLIILNPKTSDFLDEADNNDDEKSLSGLTRQSSVKSYAGSESIYQDDYLPQKSLKHISDDQTDLNKLLRRTEDSDSDSSGPLQKIKNIKTSFFTRRFGSLRSRKSDKQDDQISIQSNSSDTSRISLTDIRNEFRKFKRLKKPKYRKTFVNKLDEGIGMASILARSVIHAHTSLACIAETQDSEHSPSSTMRRTSESEPTINISDEEKFMKAITDGKVESSSTNDDIKGNPPEMHMSLKNISTTEKEGPSRQRKLSESCPATPVANRSDNFLKLPTEADYFGSASLSGDSSEVYTSSEEDDESSDQKTDTEKSIETTSSIVQNALNNGVSPKLIAHLDRKLSTSETLPDPLVIHHQVAIVEDDSDIDSNSSKELPENSNRNVADTDAPVDVKLLATTEKSDIFTPPKSTTHHFKFHNPFSHKKVSKSLSAPSSPVESKGIVFRSSKKIKQRLAKLSKSSMMKSLSHYSLIPKKKHVEPKAALSQPGSSSDMTSKYPSHETVLGSPFMSYADLMSLDKETANAHAPHHKSDEVGLAKVTMYIGSEPVSRASVSGPSSPLYRDETQDFDPKYHKKASLRSASLVHTAMETILMDKVQSLLVPTSPEPEQTTEKQFFNDVNVKLEEVEKARSSTKEIVPDSPVITEIHHDQDYSKKDDLIHTAMETMLMDRFQSLMGPTIVETSDANLENHRRPRHDSCKSQGNDDDLQGTNKLSKESNDIHHHHSMKHLLMDKCHSIITASSEFIHSHDGHFGHRKKDSVGGFLHTAMETVLLDKVQSLLPLAGMEVIPPSEDKNDHDKNEMLQKPTDICDGSLTQSAMQTILLDKVQSLLLQTPTDQQNSAIKQENIEQPSMENNESIEKRDKMLTRQDSVHSLKEEESPKMSKETESNIVVPIKMSQYKSYLQHFHPILSGASLETIPSLPESFDRAESLEVEGTCNYQSRCDSDTNSASVCDNSHAACRFDRVERVEREKEREKAEKEKGSPRHARHESYGSREPVVPIPQAQNPSLNSSTPMGIHRRSSDSDLSVTPKGGSLNASAGNVGSGGGAILRPSMNSNNLEMLEYPFLTMTEFPPGFIVHLGGTVCARSVKLVDAGGECASRAAWWAELRTELRAHARVLRCNAVLAYTENTAICEDVCVLSASGTAAVINLDCDFNTDAEVTGLNDSKNGIDEIESESCSVGHVPYSPGTGPYRAELSTCGGCRRARVPAVLLATCVKPSMLPAYTKSVTVTAVAARVRRAPPAGEPGARDISDQLPFLEYELHKLLLAKLRMQGANALFSLQTQISIGERCVIALASGTAVRLMTLPPPNPPRIKASENDKDALEIQNALWDAFAANKVANGYDIGVPENNPNGALPEVEGEELPPALDLCSDKDACVLELDEAEDVETAKSLSHRRMPMQVFANTLKAVPKAPPQTFLQVWRARFTISGQGNGASIAAERHVTRALDGVMYKLRRLQPCAIVTPHFQLELPEDEIQLVVSGAAIPLIDKNKPEHVSAAESLNSSNGNQGSVTSYGVGTGDADDDIFTLDEEQLVKPPIEAVDDKNLIINGQVPTTVSLTSLSFVSGSRIARRICALRLLFVRETTAVRELGGLSGFLHTFTCEVLAIVRAYTAALGGNALTSFYITQLMLQDNAHKNQSQCLLSVGGDVVHITY